MYMYISRKTLIFLNFCRTRFSSCRKLETYLLLRSRWAYTHRLWAIDRENINIYNRWNRLMVLYESDKDQTFIKSFIILSFVQTVQMFECFWSDAQFFGKKNLVTIYHRRLKELLPELTQRIKEWNGKDYIIKLKLRDTFQTIPPQHTCALWWLK